MKHILFVVIAICTSIAQSGAQVKTGENFAVTETNSGKERG